MTRAAELAAIVNASRELLGQGDAEGAERLLNPVLQHLRSDAAALHLMGLIKKAQKQLKEAERYFRSAIAYGLSEGAYYNDLGVVLQALGQYEEAARVLRAALALVPQAGAIRANLVRCFLSAGDLAEAEREAKAYVAIDPGAESWTLLGQVQRSLDRPEEVLACAEAALRFGPRLRGLRYNHATALELNGRAKEALAEFEQLAKQELDTPELAMHLIRALYAEGRKKDAEAVAEQAVQAWPGSTALNTVLGRIRWLRGENENCTAITEAELQWRRPSDIALRLVCADVLHRGGHIVKAVEALEQALRYAPDSPALLTSLGMTLDELDRTQDALRVLRRVAEIAPSPVAQRNLLSTLLRARQPEEALSIVRALRQQDASEQYLIACEATALRMLGDPAYRALCDFDRMVRSYEIAAPKGHFTIESFNAALADFLRVRHRVDAHPLDQMLPNGSKTARNLLALHDALVRTFHASIDACVRDYIMDADADSPVGQRRGKQYRYANMWSVRLVREGAEPNHIHDRGWISGVYLAAAMPPERPNDPHAGWLKLGEPNRAPAGIGPERFIEPKVGQLLLFPSYIWQGVAPVEGAERLTAAFTLAPA
ncbi:MAG: tetratricopeptide repeat protein [Hyphomonadaceae bacterium]|nr:tetratricopeptide repeat protein [Hyphomonadaceae bacterium]